MCTVVVHDIRCPCQYARCPQRNAAKETKPGHLIEIRNTHAYDWCIPYFTQTNPTLLALNQIPVCPVRPIQKHHHIKWKDDPCLPCRRTCPAPEDNFF